MDAFEPAVNEFFARKDHVLNLEMRQFILVFALQIIFFVHCYFKSKNQNNKNISLGILFSYYILLFELIAINGKMGLISVYLRQFELYLLSNGFCGLVWESKALDNLIFTSFNAFTLPASISIIMILCQSIILLYGTLNQVIASKIMVKTLLFGLSILLIYMFLKSITVDFFNPHKYLF